MKSILAAAAVSFLVLVLAGCSQSPPTAAVATTPPPPAGVMLVKLKLPGMTCGGCAMDVQDTLTKVDGVSHVATDPAKRECSFWFAKTDGEIKATLDELAKSNDKIAGYERLN